MGMVMIGFAGVSVIALNEIRFGHIGEEFGQNRISLTPDHEYSRKPIITILISLYRCGDGDDTEAGGAKARVLSLRNGRTLWWTSQGFTPQGTGLTLLLP